MKRVLKSMPIVLFAVIFALAFALVLVPATGENVQDDVALAADAVSYKYYDNGEYKTGSRTDYTVLTAGSNNLTTGWYYVGENITISNTSLVAITWNSTTKQDDAYDVNIIIKDGVTLTIDGTVVECNSINVYGQSTDFDTQGKISFVNVLNSTYKHAIRYRENTTFHCVNLSIGSYKNGFAQASETMQGLIAFYNSKAVIEPESLEYGYRAFNLYTSDIQIIDSDFRMDEKYCERVNSFFAFRDNMNCERTFNAISNMNNGGK